jgi:hypothetical protein
VRSDLIDYDRFGAVLGVIMSKSEGLVALHTYSRYEFRYEYESTQFYMEGLVLRHGSGRHIMPIDYRIHMMARGPVSA